MATIIAISRRNDSGTALNPKSSPSDVEGSATVTTSEESNPEISRRAGTVDYIAAPES